MSKDMEEQIKFFQKMLDVVDRTNRKINMTPLLYKLD